MPSKNISFEVDGMAAHLVDDADRDMRTVEIGVEQAQPFGPALDLASGVVRARMRILLATCAVEIQIFWPDRT